MKKIILLIFVLITLISSGCGMSEHLIVRKEQTLSLKNGEETVSYIYGQILLPMNRNSPDSKKIEVSYYLFTRKDTAAKSTPPIFDLPAGPGGRDIPSLLSQSWYFSHMIEPYLEYTDYLVINHRGFMDSFDTSCGAGEEIPLSEINNDKYIEANSAKTVRTCRQMLEGQGVDLTGFNTKQASADVRDLALSLEYKQIQLIGNSYGSHWGLNVIRDYPELVARATLSAIEGPDHTYDMPSQLLEVLEKIAKQAENHPGLQKHIPKEGLIAAYKKKIDELDKQPVTVKTIHPDSQEAVNYILDGDDLRKLILGYNSRLVWRYQMKKWPLDLLKVINGEYEDLVQERIRMKLYTGLNDAAYFHIDCGSGISVNRGQRLRNDPAADYVGKTWEFYDKSCQYWDADLGESYRKAFKSDVPTLLIQGSWDILTFNQNTTEVLAMLDNGKVVYVEGGSHGALREAKESDAQFNIAIHHWLATGKSDQLPEKIVLPKLEWNSFEIN